MKKGEFIDVGKRMVMEYFNRFVYESNEVKKITENDIAIIGFMDIPTGYKLILTTLTPKGLYYGITYNAFEKEFKTYIFDIYEKDGVRVIGKKEPLRR